MKYSFKNGFGEGEQPPRSPDLPPLDKTKPDDLGDLRQRIVQETKLIFEEVLPKAVSPFYTRNAHCPIVD